MPPEVCPNCGTEVPRNVKACPECGSDENTGWSETASADNLGLLDEEFNYDEFVKEEFGSAEQNRMASTGFGGSSPCCSSDFFYIPSCLENKKPAHSERALCWNPKLLFLFRLGCFCSGRSFRLNRSRNRHVHPFQNRAQGVVAVAEIQPRLRKGARFLF